MSIIKQNQFHFFSFHLRNKHNNLGIVCLWNKHAFNSRKRDSHALKPFEVIRINHEKRNKHYDFAYYYCAQICFLSFETVFLQLNTDCGTVWPRKKLVLRCQQRTDIRRFFTQEVNSTSETKEVTINQLASEPMMMGKFRLVILRKF